MEHDDDGPEDIVTLENITNVSQKKPYAFFMQDGCQRPAFKNKMSFNVGGIEAETREGLVTEITKFMETEEGKK